MTKELKKKLAKMLISKDKEMQNLGATIFCSKERSIEEYREIIETISSTDIAKNISLFWQLIDHCYD